MVSRSARLRFRRSGGSIQISASSPTWWLEWPEELHEFAVTWAELCYGVENSPPEKRGARRQQLGEFARRLLVLPFEERSGPVYGRVRAQLRRDGALIGANDLLIAAHALAAGCTLVTNNVREFQRVEGLVVENWV